MKESEKRLGILKRLLVVKICRKEEKEFSTRIYFKFRKYHPFIIILFAYYVLRETIGHGCYFAKEMIDELNEEDYIETIKEK